MLVGAVIWAIALLLAPWLPAQTALHFVPIFTPHIADVAPLLLGVWLAARRLRRREAVRINGVVLAGLVVAGASLLIPMTQPSNPDSPDFRAMSLNAKMPPSDHLRLVELIRREKIDVVLLQENYGNERSPAEAIIKALPGWHVTQKDALAIASRWPMGEAMYTPLGTFNVNGLLEAEIKRPEGAFRVVNVHWQAPHVILPRFASQRELEWKATMQAIERSSLPTVLGGDFNSPPRYGRIQQLHALYGPTAVGRSFHLKRVLPLVQLDYLWGVNGLRSLDARIGPTVGSDHMPVIGSFELKP